MLASVLALKIFIHFFLNKKKSLVGLSKGGGGLSFVLRWVMFHSFSQKKRPINSESLTWGLGYRPERVAC